MTDAPTPPRAAPARERHERGDWNCPHCGRWPFADRLADDAEYFMSCDCGACGPYCPTQLEAIDAWNLMAAPRRAGEVTLSAAQVAEIGRFCTITTGIDGKPAAVMLGYGTEEERHAATDALYALKGAALRPILGGPDE